MSSPRPPELDALDAIRLNKDWSIRELAASMAARGCRVCERTLHYLLKEPDRQPYDRTLYKIRVYLVHADKAAAKAQRRQLRVNKARAAAIRGGRDLEA